MTQPQQNFIDKQGPVLASAWLNEVDAKRLLLPWNAAGNLILGMPLPKFTAAEQNRASTAMLDDGYLVWPSMPPGTYLIRGFLQFFGSGVGTQGLNWKLNGGFPLTGNNWMRVSGIVNNVTWGPALFSALNTATVQNSQISTASVYDYQNFEAIMTTTEQSEISLQWGQHSASANPVVLSDRSWMVVIPVS